MKDSIIQPPIGELLEKVDNKFSLVILSAKVARHNIELEQGNKQDKHINFLTKSVREIYEEKIDYELLDIDQEEK